VPSNAAGPIPVGVGFEIVIALGGFIGKEIGQKSWVFRVFRKSHQGLARQGSWSVKCKPSKSIRHR
jgi:hypothetical protein